MRLVLQVSWLLVFVTITHQSISTRLVNEQSYQSRFPHKSISFFMQDVLCSTYYPPRPMVTEVEGQLPFQSPLNEGTPLPESNPTVPLTDGTLNVAGFDLSFPTIATLRGLKFGLITTIDEELIQGPLFGSSLIGKVQGVYVANSDDGSSHMMAMTAKFLNDDLEDSLRFFGVHQTSALESHISIIGGTGKYHGANGFATVKAVTIGSGNEDGDLKKFLLFTIYLGDYGV